MLKSCNLGEFFLVYMAAGFVWRSWYRDFRISIGRNLRNLYCNNTRHDCKESVTFYDTNLRSTILYFTYQHKWLNPSFKQKLPVVLFHMLKQLPSITHSIPFTAPHLLWAHKSLW